MAEPAPIFPEEQTTQQQEAPHAVDAEHAVLGALLINNDLFAKVDDIALKSEHFYDKRHRLIYQYMLKLHNEGHVDPLLLVNELREGSKLNEVGGDEYIAEIADSGAAPVNVGAYAGLIRDMAFLRALLTAHNDSINEGFRPDGKAPLQLLDAAEGRLFTVGDAFQQNKSEGNIADLAKQYTDKIIANRQDMSPLRGTHPGFERLYQKTLGLHGGDLIILAGRPGSGKTAFGLNIMTNIATLGEGNVGVLCFSMEMSAEQLVRRMLGNYGLNTYRLHASKEPISSSTLQQLAHASSRLEELPIYIDDSGLLNILEARTRARRTKREMEKNGIKLGLIMVDYLQLMEAVPGSRYDSRTLEVSAISRGLKALAKELKVPVLALSQLNRSIANRPDQWPVMSDLRESGSIEQDADLILFLHQEKREDRSDNNSTQPMEVKLIIEKQRNGPVGVIDMIFDKRVMMFKETPREQEIPDDHDDTG